MYKANTSPTELAPRLLSSVLSLSLCAPGSHVHSYLGLWHVCLRSSPRSRFSSGSISALVATLCIMGQNSLLSTAIPPSTKSQQPPQRCHQTLGYFVGSSSLLHPFTSSNPLTPGKREEGIEWGCRRMAALHYSLPARGIKFLGASLIFS